jgi:uncharacterized membrane protein YfcA
LFDQLLPPEIGSPVALALVAASFCTSALTAAFGLGGGVVLLAILGTLLPPAALIPIHGVVQLGSNVGRTLMLRAAVARNVLLPFLAGSLLGIALGAMLVIELPPAGIQIGVGAFILWSVVGTPPGFLRRSAWLAGGVSSFLTMFFGATGPFVAAYVKAQRFGRVALVATSAACMTAQHLLKVIAFGLLGFAFTEYLGLIAGMVASGFLGTLAGGRVLMRIDEHRFGLVLNAILVILAARLIWEGVVTLAAGSGAEAGA